MKLARTGTEGRKSLKTCTPMDRSAFVQEPCSTVPRGSLSSAARAHGAGHPPQKPLATPALPCPVPRRARRAAHLSAWLGRQAPRQRKDCAACGAPPCSAGPCCARCVRRSRQRPFVFLSLQPPNDVCAETGNRPTCRLWSPEALGFFVDFRGPPIKRDSVSQSVSCQHDMREGGGCNVAVPPRSPRLKVHKYDSAPAPLGQHKLQVAERETRFAQTGNLTGNIGPCRPDTQSTAPMRQAPMAGTRDSESTLTLTPMVNAHAEQDRRREIQVPTATNGNALRNTRCRGDDRCYFRISLIGKGGKLTTHQHSSAPKPGRLSPSRSRFSCVSMCRSSHVNSNNSIPSRCYEI